MAKHREPSPADQQTDRPHDRQGEQPLGQCRDARTGHDPGGTPRRQAARRGHGQSPIHFTSRRSSASRRRPARQGPAVEPAAARPGSAGHRVSTDQSDNVLDHLPSCSIAHFAATAPAIPPTRRRASCCCTTMPATRSPSPAWPQSASTRPNWPTCRPAAPRPSTLRTPSTRPST